MIISDAEKIDIMQHYIDGGEIESKHLASGEWFNCAGPSWNWSEGDYRKRVYNYPLYFECILYSSKFIVEFTGLTEGTVVQTTYSSLQIGYFEEAWQPHTDKNIWREVQKPESQIVYECYRTNKKTGKSEMLTKLLTDDMLNILQEDERIKHTYHKTGRSFEIKLGDK